MEKKSVTLGESELEIMKILWHAGQAVNTQYINHAAAKKNWKRTTISTYLARLVEKGAIVCEKQGNQYFYQAILLEEEYRKGQTKHLIQSLYAGSVKDFAVALFREETLSKEEIAQLRAIFDEKEGE